VNFVESFSYVRNGVLYIKPTLTADRFGEDFLYNGTLDMWKEGCNVNYNGGCIAYAKIFLLIQLCPLYEMFSLLSGRLQRTSSIQFNPPGCALSTRSALLTARSRYALKCPVAIGFGLVWYYNFRQLNFSNKFKNFFSLKLFGWCQQKTVMERGHDLVKSIWLKYAQMII
jgi:hypothetical protein